MTKQRNKRPPAAVEDRNLRPEGTGGLSANDDGGAGRGDGLFVGNTATVTLNQVYFAGDHATGGAGGASNSGGAGFHAGGA
jgi:hypothetical protein